MNPDRDKHDAYGNEPAGWGVWIIMGCWALILASVILWWLWSGG